MLRIPGAFICTDSPIVLVNTFWPRHQSGMSNPPFASSPLSIRTLFLRLSFSVFEDCGTSSNRIKVHRKYANALSL